MKILVIEDDLVIAELLSRTFENEKTLVDVVRDGNEGLSAAFRSTYSVIVLDIMLPGIDGWEVCRRIREAKIMTPILMLTARDSIDDRVKGLQAGADDYLPKPFDVREFLARIQALHRRDKVNKTGFIKIDDLVIDTVGHSVTRGGQVVKLTQREYSLLEALARNEGRTLTREVILERVWDEEESLLNTVNFHIASLRKKIDADHDVKLIRTVHGIGYSLKPQRDE
jgi:two-component system copper resistance phosphate regulon response regulator CusR